MLEPGKYICHVCGKVSNINYYYHARSGIGAVLTRVPETGEYRLRPYFPENKERTDHPGFTLRMQADPDPEDHGAPTQIRAVMRTDDGTRSDLALRRCCPCCSTMTRLYRDYGTCPLYVIALTGMPTTGKSTWVTAIANPLTLARLRESGCRWDIEPVNLSEMSTDEESTPTGSIGRTTYLLVRDEEGQIRAGVLVRDFSGELFGSSGAEEDERWKEYSREWSLFARQRGGYDGPDLYFIMDSAVPIPGRSEQAITAFNSLRDNARISGKPLGLILTHADQLMEAAPPDPGDPTGQVPLINKRTFPSNTSYRPRALAGRLALENYLVSRISSLGRYLAPRPGYRGFLVKSCEKVGTRQNFENPINVLDPLIWALNTLGIFPMDEKG